MQFFTKAIYLFSSSLILSACDVNISTSPGSLEDMNTPKVIEGLTPLPPERAAYAQEVIRAFYSEGMSAVQTRTHPTVAKEFQGMKAEAIEKLASNSARVEDMEYYGHGYGQERGFDFTIIEYKVPNDNGYDEVKVIVSSAGECCQILGFNLMAKLEKSFTLGGKN